MDGLKIEGNVLGVLKSHTTVRKSAAIYNPDHMRLETYFNRTLSLETTFVEWP